MHKVSVGKATIVAATGARNAVFAADYGRAYPAPPALRPFE
jgi:hypothetical protein